MFNLFRKPEYLVKVEYWPKGQTWPDVTFFDTLLTDVDAVEYLTEQMNLSAEKHIITWTKPIKNNFSITVIERDNVHEL